jgi:hypothetical protein
MCHGNEMEMKNPRKTQKKPNLVDLEKGDENSTLSIML